MKPNTITEQLVRIAHISPYSKTDRWAETMFLVGLASQESVIENTERKPGETEDEFSARCRVTTRSIVANNVKYFKRLARKMWLTK